MKQNFSWLKILWLTLVLTFPGIIIYSLFQKVFECPACYLFEDGGDGLKNYFTLDYYVQHDSGWNFSGMNYPYGENIIYTDSQPILALTLQWIDRHVIDMDKHVVGTLNMLLLISIYLAFLITYLLLRRWTIGKWWALGAATCITFMSPQLWRLHGHYGLGYVFYIPLMLLLLDLVIRSEKKRWLWATALGGLTIVTSLTHMYFLLFSSVVIFSITAFWWLYHRKDKAAVKKLMPLLIGALILPGLFLVGLRKWTDPVQDRPTEPYGIDNHTITFETTFFSFIPPFDNAWTKVLNIEKPITERSAYVGLIGLLLLPAALWFLLRRNDEQPLNTHLKIFLWAAIVSWCMASGLIYQHGFRFLWEAAPVLKQFRGLGRFGIPFYYLYLLVCSYILWQAYLKIKESDLGRIGGYMLGSVLLIWGFESWANIKAVSKPELATNHTFTTAKDDYMPLLASAGYAPDDFQAILQLPLVVIGNENMGVIRGHWTLREGIHAASETGLPLIDYAMSRTSIRQGLDLVELISTPYAPKQRAINFSDKPILLLCEEEFVIPAEQQWIDQAKKIGSYKSITLYALPAEVFKQTTPPPLPDERTNIASKGWFDGFDQNQCDTIMSGTGALPITQPFTKIWSYTDTASTARQWNASFWSHVDDRKGATPEPRLLEKNDDGETTLYIKLMRENINWSEAFGEWIQVSIPLTTLGRGYTYELYIDNAGPVIDNLLIHPSGDTCIYFYPEMTLYNNLPIPNTK
jgi:hypothetical protein